MKIKINNTKLKDNRRQQNNLGQQKKNITTYFLFVSLRINESNSNNYQFYYYYMDYIIMRERKNDKETRISRVTIMKLAVKQLADLQHCKDMESLIP